MIMRHSTWRGSVLLGLLVSASVEAAELALPAMLNLTSTLTCRIAMDDTLYQRQEDGSMYNEEVVSCIPLLDAEGSVEDEEMYAIDLPPALALAHEAVLEEGHLHLSVTEARIDVTAGKIQLQESSVFRILDQDDLLDHHVRRLKDYTDASGVRRYAVVRVSTQDKSPQVSVNQIRHRYTNSGMEAQYGACSIGKLDWQLANVYDVKVSGTVASYGSDARNIRDAAVIKLKADLGISTVPNDIADNILFCMPPGTGGWVANAGTGHWRSQFNDGWCLSLTAVMHEVRYAAGAFVSVGGILS
jgi:hypothetical protein